MKRLLFLSITLFTAYFTQAQTEQGRFVIDAKSNFGFINNSPNEGIKNEFSFNLQGGYALVDNLFVGPSLDYESLNISNDGPRISGFLYGAFARYYFNFKEDQKVLPFISINYFFGENRIDDLITAGPDGSSISISDSFSVNKLSLNAGLSIFLIPKSLSLDINLSYIERDVLITDRFLVPLNDELEIYQFNLGFSFFL